jgi:PqqD family protein of HPr-rel-A system
MNTQLADLLLNDRGFAFNPASGETYQLNTTGLVMVRLMQQGLNHEEILTQIREKFDVDDHTARRDLEAFIDETEKLGWKP